MEENIKAEKMIRKAAYACVVLHVLLGGFIKPLSALAMDASYSLEPFFKEVELSNGEPSKAFSITVSNETESDATFRVSVKDFGTLDESGGIVFLGSENNFSQRYGLVSWMRSTIDQITVPAGESVQIPVIVENRESLPPGGYYGAVVFELLGDHEDTRGSLVSVQSSFAALVFVNKTGGEIREMNYSGMSVVGGDLFGIPEKVSVRFQNTGNTHIVPRGRITVTDMLGRVVREGVLNADSGRMLPESFRVFPVGLKSVGSANFPGPYTVAIDYRYDGKGDYSGEHFSVFPIGMSIAWLVALLGLITASFAVLRGTRQNRRNENRR